ncbi:hypothetical protein HDV00_005623 [Rhizophlyctis rosea]|nr:hypothetical protein HDV00_005623 [Rhizophlyctis rosea]
MNGARQGDVSDLSRTDREIRERKRNTCVSASEQFTTEGGTTVLLRRLAIKNAPSTSNNTSTTTNNDKQSSYYIIIGDEARTYIQNELLFSLQNESVASVRRKICDTTSTLTDHLLSLGGTWPDLLHAVFQLVNNATSTEHRKSGFMVVANVPDLVAEGSGVDLQGVLRFLGTGLGDGDAGVRVQALRATVSYITNLPESSQPATTQMIPQMLNVLPPLVNDEELLKEALGCLVDVAEWAPKMLRGVLGQVVEFCVGVMGMAGVDDAVRQTSLELLLTFAESLPSAARKQNAQFAAKLVPVLLQWMSEIEDDPSWGENDGEEDDDEEARWLVGSQGLDRLSLALGGKSVLPPLFALLPSMLSSQQWQSRHAALMAISAIAEGCRSVMEAELGKVVGLVVPYLRDAEGRVRWAGCNCLGQLSTDFAPTVQQNYAEQVLGSLVPVMDDAQNPRVQAHAAAALVNFCEELSAGAIAPYLDEIFRRLMALLRSPKLFVQEQAITTIATVADAAEKGFVKYYGDVMPMLLDVLRTDGGKEGRMVRGKCVECATLIALAVGKETFAPDAPRLIELLRQIQMSISEDDDPRGSYLLAGWARVCKCLGGDFLQGAGGVSGGWFEEVVMGPLVRSSELRPEFVQLEDAEDMEKYDGEEGWEFVEVEGKKLAIKNAVLDEKCTAVEMFICYARELGAGFAPWVDRVLGIVVPLLKFYFNEDVRHAACAVIPLLFRSLVLANAPKDQVLGKWYAACGVMVEVLGDEVDPGFLCQGFVALQETIEILGKESFTPQLFDLFTESVLKQMTGYFERVGERSGMRKEVDYDAEDEEALQGEEENDDLFLSELSKVLHEILKVNGEGFLPYFDRLVPIVDACLKHPEVATRQWSLCVWDDIIEYTGPSSSRYTPHFLPQLLQSLLDPAHEIRQAAAYGIGVAAQYGGPAYHQACKEALTNLFAVVRSEGSRGEDVVLATENCVSAVGKICKFVGGGSGSGEWGPVLEGWVGCLPVLRDEEEVGFVYGFLCELVESHNTAVLGPSNNNVPHLVSVMVEALAAPGLVTDNPERKELAERMVRVLRGVLGGVGDDVRGRIWNGLSLERRGWLQGRGFV